MSSEEVRDEFQPTNYQRQHFDAWVLWSDGHDDSGDYLGHCPLHDRTKEREASAIFNFRRGVMRCQGDPSCHEGKRAVSLQNVVVRMTADGGI